MDTGPKPIFLFADSQLLFYRENGSLAIDGVRALVRSDNPRAAYVGASNGDDAAFYSIFEAAMEGVGISNCRHIRSELRPQDLEFVEQADIILLAGGDVSRGLAAMKENGLIQLIPRRHREGVVLIGISAGAVQLGLCDSTANSGFQQRPAETLKLVPQIVGVHDEANDWNDLKRAVRRSTDYAHGIGIPTGGGLVYNVDHSIEPLRRSVYDFYLDDRGLVTNLIVAGELDLVAEVGTIQ